MNNDAFSKNGRRYDKTRQLIMRLYRRTRVLTLKSGKNYNFRSRISISLTSTYVDGKKEKMNMNERNRPRELTCRRGETKRENGWPGNNTLSNIVINPVSISITGAIKISVLVSITRGANILEVGSAKQKRKKERKRNR